MEEFDPMSEAPRGRHFSLIRAFVLADVITLINAACGTAAILLAVRYAVTGERASMWAALVLLPVAAVCDFLDGYVARWRHRHSPYGADLDSLADIVSFGVAPAVLGFVLGLDGGWDALVLIYFVACGISRLARFNVTAPAMSDESGKVTHFEGTPILTSLLVVALLAVAFGTGAIGEAMWGGSLPLGSWQLHPLVLLYALSGSAMISATLKIPKI